MTKELSLAVPHENKAHIASLDGFRGLAISLVLINHLLWSNSQTGSRVLNAICAMRGAGWVGVDLFFALSGFLITGILFDTLNSNHYFRNFYTRRALRIFPLYYGVVLVLFATLYLRGLKQMHPVYLLLVYLQNTPLWWTYKGAPFISSTMSYLWSLAVEEQFYLVWPLLVFFIRGRRRLMWTALILAALAPISRWFLLAHGASFASTYELTICRADSLLGGAWLALAVRGRLRDQVVRFAPPFLLLAFVVCVAIGLRSGSFDWEQSRDVNLYGYSFVAIGSVSLIAMSLRSGSMTASVMQFGVLRFLGKYSYGIYVYHQLINIFIEGYLSKVLHAHIESKILFHLVYMIVALLAIIPTAVLSFHFYEQPFLRLKKYFSYSDRRTSAASHPSAQSLEA
jgi:peptidoglycan/LPS O-acetylase OafA/YrhL